MSTNTCCYNYNCPKAVFPNVADTHSLRGAGTRSWVKLKIRHRHSLRALPPPADTPAVISSVLQWFQPPALSLRHDISVVHDPTSSSSWFPLPDFLPGLDLFPSAPCRDRQGVFFFFLSNEPKRCRTRWMWLSILTHTHTHLCHSVTVIIKAVCFCR